MYEELVEKGKTSSFLHIIEADVGRSFPLIPFFKKGTKYGDAGQRSLTNVLQAYSVYDENVGYCQGMNQLAAFILLMNGCQEREAFWFLVSLLNPGSEE